MYENVQFEIAIFIHFKTAIDNVPLNNKILNIFLIMPSRKSRDFSYGMDRPTMIEYL